jgi:predicted nucleic acid-binding protein
MSSSPTTYVRSTLVTDTSVAFAALDRSEKHHVTCSELVTSAGMIALPAPVVTETCMLPDSRRVEIHPLLDSVVDGTVVVVDLDRTDYVRVRQLMKQYADLALGFVDAAVVAVAERLQEGTIATLDRRHFSVVRPQHVEAFTLVPSLD